MRCISIGAEGLGGVATQNSVGMGGEAPQNVWECGVAYGMKVLRVLCVSEVCAAHSQYVFMKLSGPCTEIQQAEVLHYFSN